MKAAYFDLYLHTQFALFVFCFSTTHPWAFFINYTTARWIRTPYQLNINEWTNNSLFTGQHRLILLGCSIFVFHPKHRFIKMNSNKHTPLHGAWSRMAQSWDWDWFRVGKEVRAHHHRLGYGQTTWEKEKKERWAVCVCVCVSLSLCSPMNRLMSDAHIHRHNHTKHPHKSITAFFSYILAPICRPCCVANTCPLPFFLPDASKVNGLSFLKLMGGANCRVLYMLLISHILMSCYDGPWVSFVRNWPFFVRFFVRVFWCLYSKNKSKGVLVTMCKRWHTGPWPFVDSGLEGMHRIINYFTGDPRYELHLARQGGRWREAPPLTVLSLLFCFDPKKDSSCVEL